VPTSQYWCVAVGDNGSRELLRRFLLDENTNIDYLEGQLHAIEEMTYENYLAQQWEKSNSSQFRFSVLSKTKRGGQVFGFTGLLKSVVPGVSMQS